MAGEFTALLVHDIKNQLGQLEAELHLLSHHPEAERAARAHRQCAQLRQRLIAWLTLYGAPEGGLQAWMEAESPKALLEHLTHLPSRPDAAPLTVLTPAGTPELWYFDRRLVQLALESALHNAWRFARQQVQVSAHVDGDELVWWVEDDGPGPGADDPQWQAATGLGLRLCEAVAAAHREGSRRGHTALLRGGLGTRFEMRLP